ncbi:MAG TPA: hypothetical protein VKC17_10835 [Sphingomicrobium sp.]|nr:hypothetical protein [Sphingomicrobium sp.]
MNRTISLIGAVAVALAPTIAFAAPPASGSISPNHETGQPGVECEEGGTAPSQSGREPGPGTPFLNEESVSAAHYAGHQPGINDKNTASNSQYDIACFGGPDRPSGE